MLFQIERQIPKKTHLVGLEYWSIWKLMDFIDDKIFWRWQMFCPPMF